MPNTLLVGAILAVSLVIGLFFLRFWLVTRDRFFLCFALSFFIQGGNHLLLLAPAQPDSPPAYYFLRILSYALIVAGIIGKNLRQRNPVPPVERKLRGPSHTR